MRDGRPDLTFREFQAANEKRCAEAFDHSLDDWEIDQWTNALAGEVGEACNIAKKLSRQAKGVGGKWAARDPSPHVLRQQLASEIGDVQAYLSLLASKLGLDLEDCAASKFDFISRRAEWDGPRLSRELP